MLDKDKPEFWRSVKPDSTITLTDEQSIVDSIERGEGVSGRDYIVESIWKIQHDELLAEWLLFNLGDDEQNIYLVLKIVDQHIDIYVYYEPDEFPPGNRRDVVERGDEWIFEEPADFDNFKYDELGLMREIIMNVEIKKDDDIRNEDVAYRMKGQGVMYGNCTHDPAQAGIGRIMATVVEYSTDDSYDNPEMMILELGGEHSDEGGLISLMLGCGINLSDVDVLKSQKEKPVERKKLTLWEKLLIKMSK